MKDAHVPTAEQILEALREGGVSQRAIAERLNMPRSAVSNLYTGNRQLKLHEAQALIDMVPSRRKPLRVPLIGMAGAGKWIEAVEVAQEMVTIPPEAEAHGQFAVTVNGDSMNLLLPEGSIAVIDTTDLRLYANRLYVLRNDDGEATIKRYRSDPARFEPVSDNNEYAPFEVGSTPFEVIGRVTTGILRF